MIDHLRISGLGVIGEATVDLDPGFTVVTGETGAGKTMVVTALGLLLAWLVLPFVTLTGDGAAAIPSPVIVVPWGSIAPIWLLSGVLLLVTVVAVRRQLPSNAIGGVLRAGDA